MYNSTSSQLMETHSRSCNIIITRTTEDYSECIIKYGMWCLMLYYFYMVFQFSCRLRFGTAGLLTVPPQRTRNVKTETTILLVPVKMRGALETRRRKIKIEIGTSAKWQCFSTVQGSTMTKYVIRHVSILFSIL